MKQSFALILFLLSFVCTAQEGQDNPFMEMAGKPYAEKIYFPPPDTQGGWRTLEQPEDVLQKTGFDTRKLDEVFEFIKKDTKNGGLLIVKDGWLVYEKYFGKGHRDAATNLSSCGKSFTSMVGKVAWIQ